MKTKKLSVHKETMRSLTMEDLGGAHGGLLARPSQKGCPTGEGTYLSAGEGGAGCGQVVVPNPINNLIQPWLNTIVIWQP